MALDETFLQVAFNNSYTKSLSFDYDTGATQDPVLVPIRSSIGVQVAFLVAGQATIEGTLDDHDKIRANTAEWVAWPEGQREL